MVVLSLLLLIVFKHPTMRILLVLASVLSVQLGVDGATPSKEETNCGACTLLIEELEFSISQVDPEKTIKVGSFRVDPSGNQDLNEIPLARSEHHLHDLLEQICEKTKYYGYAEHPNTKKHHYIRTENPDGRKRKIKFDKNDLLRSKLMFACENIVEEHEDSLLKLLKKEHEDPVVEFCVKETKLCDKSALVVDFPYELEDLPSSTESPPAGSTESPAKTKEETEEL